MFPFVKVFFYFFVNEDPCFHICQLVCSFFLCLLNFIIQVCRFFSIFSFFTMECYLFWSFNVHRYGSVMCDVLNCCDTIRVSETEHSF